MSNSSLAALVFMLALSACASPPKPPSCDGMNRRPINVQPAKDGTEQKVGTVYPRASFQCVA